MRSIDAETIVLQGEADRRKPLSLAEKRKRNETLAIGLSRTELLVSGSKEKTTKGFNFLFDSLYNRSLSDFHFRWSHSTGKEWERGEGFGLFKPRPS